MTLSAVRLTDGRLIDNHYFIIIILISVILYAFINFIPYFGVNFPKTFWRCKNLSQPQSGCVIVVRSEIVTNIP